MSVAPTLTTVGSLGDHALIYAGAGLEIFPVRPDKTPYESQYKATTDAEQIKTWWRQWPQALIGHRISPDHVVLDIDPRHGGLEVWQALKAELDVQPITRWHRSGRGDGGGHTWWLRPADKLTVTKLDQWAKERGLGHDLGTRWVCGIDILHYQHRYTILPPSPHPDTGQAYSWAGRGHEQPVAPMPALLADLVTNDLPAAPPAPPAPPRAQDPNSIADWYTRNHNWADLLTGHGWMLRAGDGNTDGSRWRHPQATAAYSATLRHGCLFVYSPNTAFEVTNPAEPHGYTLFRAYAVLEHRGDMSEAARRLREHQNLTSLNSLISPSLAHTRDSSLSAIQLSDTTNSENGTTGRNNGIEALEGEKSETSEQRSWPQLHPNAHHGPIGTAIQLLEPHTEADPTAILATLLTGWGAIIGRGPHATAGHAEHPARLSIVIVGDTAKARKGTSWATARTLLDRIDPLYMTTRVLGGFGSGESVIDEVRDPQPSDDPDKPDDPGAPDKRLLIHEPEFARILKVCARESSVLSTIIRDAWDGSRLQARARTRKAIATGHHIAIVGHITAPELGRNLNATEIAGGFANRILWICARRSKRLPFGDDNIPNGELTDLATQLARRAEEARKINQVRISDDARDRWTELYDQMADDDPGGLLGLIVARPEPQTLRIALTYALLDGSREIQTPHIDAAWALWNYSRDSATYIWGDAVGDEIADGLLRAIRKAGPDGLDLTEQSAVFARKVPAKRLATARAELEARSLIETVQEQTDGRPRTISRMKAKT